MMIRDKKKLFMLVTLILVMVVAGEVWGIRAASAAAPAKPIKLKIMIPGEPRPERPPIGEGAWGDPSSVPIFSNLLEPLVDLGKDGKPVPKLATKWEHSADFTKWRFYLRRGVKFHNGDNFTARDVVEFAKWLIEEKKVSKLYRYISLKEAVAVGDYTVDLILEKPNPLLLISGHLFSIPPYAISRDNRKMQETHPIGTGPYRFVEWKKGLSITLAKFEGYWGPKPQIEEVQILFRQEGGVRLAALIAGEVDWVYGLSSEVADLAPKVAHIPSPDTAWVKFDEYLQEKRGGLSIFADKRLRLAVEYAIDRRALVSLYKGFATLSLGQFASPEDYGFNPDLKNRPYDMEKARALVKEAGAVGKTVTLVTSTDRWVKDREVGEAIAYMIEQTGLKVKLMSLPIAEVNRYKQTQYPEKGDIVITTTDAVLEVESRFPYIFVEGGVFHATPDPKSDKLWEEVQAETDYAKRGKKIGQAWAYVYEEAHYAPLFKLEWIWGIAKNLEWKADIGGRAFFSDMRFTD